MNDLQPTRDPLAPDRLERLVSLGAALLLAAALLAIARGSSQWGRVPPIIWGHLVAAVLAMGLTPVMLLRRRGDRLHRRLGYLWVTAMALTAGLSLGVKVLWPGHFSLIHILSIYTLGCLPVIVMAARQHNVTLHRRMIRGMAIGALLVAGSFTFTFDRMLAQWLYGG